MLKLEREERVGNRGARRLQRWSAGATHFDVLFSEDEKLCSIQISTEWSAVPAEAFYAAFDFKNDPEITLDYGIDYSGIGCPSERLRSVLEKLHRSAV
jgi:hypothetical protein